MRQIVLISFILVLATLGYAQRGPAKSKRTTPPSQVVYDRVHSVPAGGYWQIAFTVPTASYQFGGFLTQDATTDLDNPVRKLIGLGPTPPPDIEILIMEESNFAAYAQNRPYSAIYTTGRQRSGNFNVFLQPGQYRIIINNRYSILTPKSVVLTLYKPQPPIPKGANKGARPK